MPVEGECGSALVEQRAADAGAGAFHTEHAHLGHGAAVRGKAARLAAGDGRPSLEALYGNQAGYVAAVRAAADDLVAQRLLLPRDADLRVREAAAANILP